MVNYLERTSIFGVTWLKGLTDTGLDVFVTIGSTVPYRVSVLLRNRQDGRRQKRKFYTSELSTVLLLIDSVLTEMEAVL